MLKELRVAENAYFKLKPKSYNTKYRKLTVECIYSLLFIVYYLELKGFTLSHICLSDFEICDNYLFLKDDEHVVELIDDYYMYESKTKTNSTEFMPPPNPNNYKTHLYKSVGQFIFWVLTHKNVEITAAASSAVVFSVTTALNCAKIDCALSTVIGSV
jgi:hypothetical protein